MKEFNDNELDRWLRENAGPSQEPPAADGWDTPPERVWLGLRAGLDRRRRRRGFLWFGALLLAVVAGTAWWWAMPDVTPGAADVAANTSVASRPMPGNAIPEDEVAALPAEPSPTPENTRAENAQSPENEQAAVAVNHSFKQKNQTPEQEPALRKPVQALITPGAGVAQNHPGTETRELALSRPALPVAESAGSATTNSGSNSPAPGTARTPESAAGLANAEAGIVPGAEPTSARGVPDAAPGHLNPETMPAASLSTAPLEAARSPIANLDLLRPDQPLLEQPERQINLPGPYPPVPADIRPLRQKPGFYAAAVTGMFFTARDLRGAGSAAPNGRESGAWTTQWGLHAGLTLNRHWNIETGIERSAIHLEAVREIALTYRKNTEQFDAQRFLYRNTAQESIETSFGAVEMRMDFGREPNRPIGDQAVLRLTLQTDEQVRYTRVPVGVRWTTGQGPLQWSIAGGIGLNFESGYQLEMTAARADRPGVRSIRANVQGRAKGLEPFMADIQLGAGLNWRLTPQWAIRLNPEFRYGLSPMYRRGAIRSMAVSGGLQLGLQYVFNRKS